MRCRHPAKAGLGLARYLGFATDLAVIVDGAVFLVNHRKELFPERAIPKSLDGAGPAILASIRHDFTPSLVLGALQFDPQLAVSADGGP
jgi:hypothetical protein